MQFALIVCDNYPCTQAHAHEAGPAWFKLSNKLLSGWKPGGAELCSRACLRVYLDLTHEERKAAAAAIEKRWRFGWDPEGPEFAGVQCDPVACEPVSL